MSNSIKYVVTDYKHFSTNGSTYEIDISDIPMNLRSEEYITVSFSSTGSSNKDQYIDSFTIEDATLNLTLKRTLPMTNSWWGNVYITAEEVLEWSIIKHKINVDIQKSNTQIVKLPQYSENSHELIVGLTNNGKEYVIPEGVYEAYLKIALSTKDFYRKYMTINIDSSEVDEDKRNTVSIILPETLVVTPGKHAVQVDLVNRESATQISSMPFMIYVTDSVYDNNVEISGPQFDELAALLVEANEKINIFETNSAQAIRNFNGNANQAISDFEDEAQDTIDDAERRFETVLEYYPSLYVRRNKIIHLYDAYANAHLQELKLYDSNGDAVSGANIAITNKNLMRIDLLPSSETIDGITFVKNNDGGIEISGTATSDNCYITCNIDKNAFVVGKWYSLNSNKTTDSSVIVGLILTYTDQEIKGFNSINDPTSFVIPKEVSSATAIIGVAATGLPVSQIVYPQIELSKSPSSFANNYYSEQYVDTSSAENVLPILPACISNIWANDDTVEEIELFYTQDVGSAMDDLHSEIGDSLAPQEIYEAINATIVDDTLAHVLHEETF